MGDSEHSADGHVRVDTTMAFRSPKLVAGSLTEGSGKAVRDRFSLMRAGSHELVERPVQVASVQRDKPFHPHGARFGERHALSREIASLEFAVSAFEVVLVEAAVIGEPPVIAGLVHVEGGRLVSVVV